MTTYCSCAMLKFLKYTGEVRTHSASYICMEIPHVQYDISPILSYFTNNTGDFIHFYRKDSIQGN